MADGERTEFSTPIPLRDNGSPDREAERPNPWSRLEAVSAARERLGWLAEYLAADWAVVSAPALGELVDALAEELHQALWGPLEAVERVRHRRPRAVLEATWAAALADAT